MHTGEHAAHEHGGPQQTQAALAGAEKSLTRFAWLSIGAALLTIALKAGAYLITGSVGLLSDAIESLVNLAAAGMALAMLIVAERPPDEDHAYGHGKAEYFSSGFEGALILIAAATIIWSAWHRYWNPVPLERVGIGLAISLVASGINLGVARTLLRAGRRYKSITLEADSQHLMTDVWTSVGVVAAVAAVWFTGRLGLDPLIAGVVALNIMWSGVGLVRRSVLGLLDTAIPAEDRAKVDGVLARYEHPGVAFHALRTRQAGMRQFVSFHMLVPGDWTVQRGHDLVEEIERELHVVIPAIHVSTHIEPLDDPRSMDDVPLDRSFVGEGQQG